MHSCQMFLEKLVFLIAQCVDGISVLEMRKLTQKRANILPSCNSPERKIFSLGKSDLKKICTSLSRNYVQGVTYPEESRKKLHDDLHLQKIFVRWKPDLLAEVKQKQRFCFEGIAQNFVVQNNY